MEIIFHVNAYLIRETGVTGIVKYHDNTIRAFWKDVFDEITPIEGRSQDAPELMISWVILFPITHHFDAG